MARYRNNRTGEVVNTIAGSRGERRYRKSPKWKRMSESDSDNSAAVQEEIERPPEQPSEDEDTQDHQQD